MRLDGPQKRLHPRLRDSVIENDVRAPRTRAPDAGSAPRGSKLLGLHSRTRQVPSVVPFLSDVV